MLSALLNSRGVGFDKIAVVCFDEWHLDIPLVLTGCTRYHTDQSGEYEKLYAFLTGQALVEKPALGKIVPIRPTLRVLPEPRERTYSALCKAIWPLMEDNKRIFEDFGPNSGAAKSNETDRVVRFDTTLWKRQRLLIDVNNRTIAEHIRTNMDIIPEGCAAIFRRFLSHIEAFAQHIANEDVDYRVYQFPREVIDIVRSEL